MNEGLLLPGVLRFVEDQCPDDFEELHLLSERCDVPSCERAVGNFLSLMTSIRKPKRILDVGCGIGLSTLYMEKGCPSADVVGIDQNINRIKKAWELMDGKDNVSILHKRAEIFLEETTDKFDFVFVDSIKRRYPMIWARLKKLLTPDAVVIFDDIFLYGHLTTELAEVPMKYRAGREELLMFIEQINHELNGKVSMIPIGGGLLMARID